MKAPLLERLKDWLCFLFGHKLKYSHTFGLNVMYECKRCRRLLREDELEESK